MLPTGPILSIEDDEDDRHFIGKIIQEMNLPNPLRFFENGLEALHYLQSTSEQPFLILCDINMPLMTGLELRQQINESQYLRHKAIPFVFLTTSSSPDTVCKAFDATVQGYYKKASTYPEMARQLTRIIEYWQFGLHPNKLE